MHLAMLGDGLASSGALGYLEAFIPLITSVAGFMLGISSVKGADEPFRRYRQLTTLTRAVLIWNGLMAAALMALSARGRLAIGPDRSSLFVIFAVYSGALVAALWLQAQDTLFPNPKNEGGDRLARSLVSFTFGFAVIGTTVAILTNNGFVQFAVLLFFIFRMAAILQSSERRKAKPDLEEIEAARARLEPIAIQCGAKVPRRGHAQTVATKGAVRGMVELGEAGNLIASPTLVLQLDPDEASFYFFRETTEAVSKTEAFGELFLRMVIPMTLTGQVMRLDKPPATTVEAGVTLLLYFAAVATCTYWAPRYRRALETRADLAALRKTNDLASARSAIAKASGIDPELADAEAVRPWVGDRIDALRTQARESGFAAA